MIAIHGHLRNILIDKTENWENCRRKVVNNSTLLLNWSRITHKTTMVTSRDGRLFRLFPVLCAKPAIMYAPRLVLQIGAGNTGSGQKLLCRQPGTLLCAQSNCGRQMQRPLCRSVSMLPLCTQNMQNSTTMSLYLPAGIAPIFFNISVHSNIQNACQLSISVEKLYFCANQPLWTCKIWHKKFKFVQNGFNPAICNAAAVSFVRGNKMLFR